jgi:hypothetical protein
MWNLPECVMCAFHIHRFVWQRITESEFQTGLLYFLALYTEYRGKLKVPDDGLVREAIKEPKFYLLDHQHKS